MSPALGRAAHFYTRHLQRTLAAAGTRSRAAIERRMLPERNKARAELQLWDEEFDTRHGQPLWPAACVCHLFHTDATADEAGAVLHSSGLVEELFRLGDVRRRTVTSLSAEGERAQSSTAREAIGLAVAVDAFAAQLAGTETTDYIDNQRLGFAWDKGSMQPDVNAPLCWVLEACRTHDIRLRVVWVPRELNTAADAVSKGDASCVRLHPHVFAAIARLIGAKHGALTIDRSADCTNTQLPRFDS